MSYLGIRYDVLPSIDFCSPLHSSTDNSAHSGGSTSVSHKSKGAYLKLKDAKYGELKSREGCFQVMCDDLLTN